MDGKMGVVKAEVRWGQRDQGQPENQERICVCVCACSVAKMRRVLGDALDGAC